MLTRFTHHCVSDRILEFRFQSISQSQRVALYRHMLKHLQACRPWQPVLTDDTIAWVYPEGLTSLAPVEQALESFQNLMATCTFEILQEVNSHVFEVHYGGQWGPDLSRVAQACGLTEAQWIQEHCETRFEVAFNGFLPGFSYLSGLPTGLQVPRLETPRTKVPVGTLAVAGAYCAVYPTGSPGGWNLVGWVNRQVFSVRQEPPCLMLPGDSVRFEPVK